MADFEYFRAEESDQFSFFRIPKALFTEKEFASLSTDANSTQKIPCFLRWNVQGMKS
mgnify:CR=1 FL=1